MMQRRILKAFVLIVLFFVVTAVVIFKKQKADVSNFKIETFMDLDSKNSSSFDYPVNLAKFVDPKLVNSISNRVLYSPGHLAPNFALSGTGWSWKFYTRNSFLTIRTENGKFLIYRVTNDPAINNLKQEILAY